MNTAVNVSLIQSEFEAIFKPSANYSHLSNCSQEEKIAECKRFIEQTCKSYNSQAKLLFGEDENASQTYFGELRSWCNGVMLFDPTQQFRHFFSLVRIGRPDSRIIENLHSQSTIVTAESLACPGTQLEIIIDLRVASAQELGPKHILRFGSASILLKGNQTATYSIPNEHAQMLDRWFDTNL